MANSQRLCGRNRRRAEIPRWVALVSISLATAVLSPELGVSGAAVAQEANDTIQPVRVAPLEVRVLRTPVREDQAALAVGALGERDLRQGKSGAFLDEALRGLAGVHVQNRYNFALGEKVVVRGFGGRAQFGVRGVKLIVDGIPATLPDGQGTLDHLDVGSLGRVEVVRGPASALFGNASGGVISFESRIPGPAPLQLEAGYVGGSNGLSRFQGTASGTVDGTGYLLNFNTQDWEGFRPNPVESLNRDHYGQASRVGLNGQLRRNLFGGQAALTVNYLDLDSENPGELTLAQIGEETRTAHGAGPVNNIARRAGKEITQTQAGLQWQGYTGSLDLDLSLYGITRKFINPIVPTIIDLDRNAGGFRFNLGRAESLNWGPLRWYVGAEIETMSDDRLNFVNNNGERGALTVDQHERVRSLGLFTQVDVPLPAGVVGLLGLRYDRHDFRARDHIERGGSDPSRTGERDMSRVSPSAGVNVPIGEQFNLFANVGTVFETPSTTELGNRPDGEGGFNPDLDPQTGLSGEIGVRGRVGQNLSFEFTTYRTNLQKEIVRYQVAAIQGRDFFRNAGSSKHTGFEATVAAGMLSGLLSGRATYTYTDARFDSFEWDGVEVGGNRIPGIAPRRAEGVLRVSPYGLFAEVIGTYVDEVPVNDRNTEGSAAPSYTLLDLRAGVASLEFGNMSIEPWVAVTNVLDEYYIASTIPNAAGASPAVARYYDPGPGRAFQVGIRTGWRVAN